MQILLNGNIYNTQNNITIHELIHELNFNNNNFAVAVNLSIIPRGKHQEVWLQANDKVEIVTAFQGG